jgi:hypothetical protein
MTIQQFFDAQVTEARSQTGCQAPVVIGDIPEGAGAFSAAYLRFDEAAKEHVIAKIVVNREEAEKCFQDGSKNAQEHLLSIIWYEMKGALNLWPDFALEEYPGRACVGLTYSGYRNGVSIDCLPEMAPWNP